ncbi:MAG: hypothetical protein ACREXM_17440, partial [Gammaproteobacteria bacterium]
ARTAHPQYVSQSSGPGGVVALPGGFESRVSRRTTGFFCNVRVHIKILILPGDLLLEYGCYTHSLKDFDSQFVLYSGFTIVRIIRCLVCKELLKYYFHSSSHLVSPFSQKDL